jgi:hypothetical protein
MSTAISFNRFMSVKGGWDEKKIDDRLAGNDAVGESTG